MSILMRKKNNRARCASHTSMWLSCVLRLRFALFVHLIVLYVHYTKPDASDQTQPKQLVPVMSIRYIEFPNTDNTRHKQQQQHWLSTAQTPKQYQTITIRIIKTVNNKTPTSINYNLSYSFFFSTLIAFNSYTIIEAKKEWEKKFIRQPKSQPKSFFSHSKWYKLINIHPKSLFIF